MNHWLFRRDLMQPKRASDYVRRFLRGKKKTSTTFILSSSFDRLVPQRTMRVIFPKKTLFNSPPERLNALWLCLKMQRRKE